MTVLLQFSGWFSGLGMGPDAPSKSMGLVRVLGPYVAADGGVLTMMSIEILSAQVFRACGRGQFCGLFGCCQLSCATSALPTSLMNEQSSSLDRRGQEANNSTSSYTPLASMLRMELHCTSSFTPTSVQ